MLSCCVFFLSFQERQFLVHSEKKTINLLSGNNSIKISFLFMFMMWNYRCCYEMTSILIVFILFFVLLTRVPSRYGEEAMMMDQTPLTIKKTNLQFNKTLRSKRSTYRSSKKRKKEVFFGQVICVCKWFS